MKKDQYVENEGLKEQSGVISNVFIEDFILDNIQKFLHNRGEIDCDEIMKCCESLGIEDYFYGCIKTGTALKIFAKACVRKGRGIVTLNQLFERMVSWCKEEATKDELADNTDKQVIKNFLNLYEEKGSAEMKSFMVAALAVGGYDVRVVPVFVFTTVEVHGITLV